MKISIFNGAIPLVNKKYYGVIFKIDKDKEMLYPYLFTETKEPKLVANRFNGRIVNVEVEEERSDSMVLAIKEMKK